jgi:hypothetical protein
MLATRSQEPAVSPAVVEERKVSGAELRAGLLAGLALLALAVPVALVIAWAHRQWPDAPARAVTVVCALFALLAPLPTAGYLLLRRGAATLETSARIALLTLVTLIAGIALRDRHRGLLPWRFPGVVESDFVNDILKLRIGYPIYSAQANNESFSIRRVPRC